LKKFDIPQHYNSSIISRIKENRNNEDPRKKKYSPTVLDFGPVRFLIARHFGFCYGVKNAIDIAYKTVEENSGKRIFLLSEMIHNPHVNEDLRNRGIDFITDNYGKLLISWDEINADDIVIIPAFGTTIELENLLKQKGINTKKYNTTCPFVEKVWNRAESIGKQNYTVVIHGKIKHEETQATFSHSVQNSPSIIIRDINDAGLLADVILGKSTKMEFYTFFKGKHSKDFDVQRDLERIGIVNQTTMLATETQAIADLLKDAMIKKYGMENIKEYFADTRDTLCYATNDNQSATSSLLNENADLAIVAGGYNSSNTSHLVELLEQKFQTYLILDSKKIISKNAINHFDIHSHIERTSDNFIPEKTTVTIAITSGASCPDSIVDEIIGRIISFFENVKTIEEAAEGLK
jgi:4-hydroxy-3-methylbut-2-en-1-yl diphosphate reductase